MRDRSQSNKSQILTISPSKNAFLDVPMMGFEPIPRFSRERILSLLSLANRRCAIRPSQRSSFIMTEQIRWTSTLERSTLREKIISAVHLTPARSHSFLLMEYHRADRRTIAESFRRSHGAKSREPSECRALPYRRGCRRTDGAHNSF